MEAPGGLVAMENAPVPTATMMETEVMAAQEVQEVVVAVVLQVLLQE